MLSKEQILELESRHHEVIYTKDHLERVISKMGFEEVYFDVETKGLDWLSPLLGISLYDCETSAFVVIESFGVEGLSISEAKSVLDPYFEKINGIAHNGKFDLLVLDSFGFKLPKLVYDTMLAVYVYDVNLKKNLEERLSEDLGWNKKTFTEIMKEYLGSKRSVRWESIKWNKETVELLARYSCEDVIGTKLLYDYYKPLVEKAGVDKVLSKIEVPLAVVLKDMKKCGVSIDVDLLHSMSKDIKVRLKQLEESIYKEAGAIFNLNSPKQKSEILFDKLGLPTYGLTDTGNYSTDVHVLNRLAGEGYEIAKLMVKYSELNKLSSNYIDGIPKLVCSDGKLRGDFNSAGARTGRMSSSNPNLQNQPNNSEFPIRDSFIPSEGKKLIVLDWSQIELRMMAHVSGDEKFCTAFRRGDDIHKFVADSLHISRKDAKIVNFGVLYGMGPNSLSGFLGISKEEASSIIQNYEFTYSGFSLWKNKIESFARNNGYVRNIFGRIRKLPDATSRAKQKEYFAALRQSVNTAIQGAAADLLKIDLVKMHQVIKDKDLKCNMLMVVHDEFIAEADVNVPGRLYHLEECFDTIKDIMENNVVLSVPVIAEGKVCDKWGDMKNDDYISLLDRPKISITDLIAFGLC